MKVGVALSGGGIRSVCHLGMIQALEEEGLTIDMVSGSSAGAVLGAFYCAGFKPKEVLEKVQSFNYLKIFKPALNWRGFLKIENAEGPLEKLLDVNKFEELSIPLVVAASNIKKGRIKYFKKGALINPLLASCSIPVVFDPIKIGNGMYVDGGLLDNLPIDPIKKECDFIVGLHCNPIEKTNLPNNWKSMMERSLLMAISTATYQKKKKCDIFWEPPTISRYNVFDYKKAQKIYDEGLKYGREQLKTKPLKEILAAA